MKAKKDYLTKEDIKQLRNEKIEARLCKQCRKGYPKLWTTEGGFCDEDCLSKYREQEDEVG